MKQFLKAIRKSRITRSSIALVLALSVLLSTFAGISIFAAPTNVWAGVADTEYDGGGSADNPYLITSAEELYGLVTSKDTQGKYYRLTTDIYLNDTSAPGWAQNSDVRPWVAPVSTTDQNSTEFKGHFDGDGHIVYGLYINSTVADVDPDRATLVNVAAGLFPIVGEGASITGVGIAGAYVSVKNASTASGNQPHGAVGALVGYMKGANVRISLCFVDEDTALYGGFIGLIGYSDKTGIKYVTNCYSVATGTANSGIQGNRIGIVGAALDAANVIVFSGCYAIGNIVGSGSSTAGVKNNYCVDAGFGAWEANVSTKVSSAAVKGEAAKTNMPLLDFKATYRTTYGYPVLQLFYPETYVPASYDVWDGTTQALTDAEKVSGSDTYLISTPEQLAWVIQTGGNSEIWTTYRLVCDIYLNDISAIDWTTGNVKSGYTVREWKTKPFAGIIDGNGYMIYGMYINNKPTAYSSNFDTARSTALVGGNVGNEWLKFSNLGMDYVYVDGANTSAVMLGSINGGNHTFDSCYIGENVTVKGYSAGGFLGGGGNATVNVTNCVSLATCIIANGGKAGSVLGDVWTEATKKIEHSYTTGKLYGNNKPSTYNNNYAGIKANSSDTATILTAAEMQGFGVLDAANGKMKALKDVLMSTDTYPVPKSVYESVTGIWDGTVADNSEIKGAGTQSDPFIIDSASKLAKMVSNTQNAYYSGYYKIVKDIYLNDINGIDWATGAGKNGYTPLNWDFATDGSSPFVDGGNHVIYGLYINKPDVTNKYHGLWSYSYNGIKVSNLGIDNAYINTGSPAGFFLANGKTGSSAVILEFTNCYVGQNAKLISSNASAGSFVGFSTIKTGTFKNCYSLADVSSTKSGARVGSFAPDVWGGSLTFENCYAIGAYHRNTCGVTYTSCYSTSVQATGLIKLEAAMMQGTDVLLSDTKMSGLAQCGKFTATETYPILTSFAPLAVEDDEVWDGSKLKPAGGSGTESDPYLIYTAEEFAWAVSATTNSNLNGYYKLMADIWLNDITKIDWATGEVNDSDYTARVWTPADFAGTIDGNGHMVYGLYINRNPAVCSSNIGSNGVGLLNGNWHKASVTFKNIGFDNVYLSGAHSAGVFIANSKEGAINIDRSFIGKNVTVKGYSAGGFVGQGSQNIAVTNCYSLTTAVKAADGKAGAILGDTWGNASIKNSYAVGKLYGNNVSSALFCYAGEVNGAVEVLTPENMTGMDALTNENKMILLGGAFTATESYPELCVFHGIAEAPAPEVPENVWDGSSATKPAEGSGTIMDPYLISNGAELAWALNGNGNGKYYRLTADIYLNDVDAINWKTGKVIKAGYMPRVWTSKTFNGFIEGDAHTIYGLYINANATTGSWGWSGAALITSTNGVTSIEKLGLDKAYVNGEKAAAGFIGLVGAGGAADFTQCYVGEDVTLHGYLAGGFVGLTGVGASIKQSYSLISPDRIRLHPFSGDDPKTVPVGGGIFGDCWGSVAISDSYSVAIAAPRETSVTSMSNVYSTDCVEKAVATIVSAANMKGLDVLSNAEKLSGLADCDAFYATDAYPVLRVFAEGLDYSTEEAEIWSGKIARTLAGSGTESDPYLISNGAELAFAITKGGFGGAYFKLTNDIFLNDVSKTTWAQSSGNNKWFSDTTAFNGHIDGDGYIVYGIWYPEDNSGRAAGLIPQMNSGSIKNLGVRYAHVRATFYAAGLIGYSTQNKGGQITVEQCFADDTCNIKYTVTKAVNKAPYGGAAGIIGYAAPNEAINGTQPALIIKNSYSKATLGGEDADRTNGIIGTAWACAYKLEDVYSYGDSPYIGWKKDQASRLIDKGTEDTADDNNNVHGDIYTDGKSPYMLEVWTYISNAENMYGEFAKTSMSGLDFKNIWKTVDETTPMLSVFKNYNGEVTDMSGDSEVYASGAGTKKNPYIIMNEAQLRYLIESKNTKNKHYKLGADIYLNDTTKKNWTVNNPSRWYNAQYNGEYIFEGIFDGDGKKIYGLYLNDTPNKYNGDGKFTNNYAGLFPYIDGNATIRNVHIRSSYISGSGYAAAIVGYVRGSGTSYVTVIGCSADESVTIKGQTTGGLVGGGYRGLKLYYSYFTGTLSATAADAGRQSGLVGDIWSADQEVAECYSVGYTNYRTNYTPALALYLYGTEAQTGTAVLTKAQMTGSAAKENMELSWDVVWYTEKGKTPQLKVIPADMKLTFTDEGEKGRVWSGKLATKFAGGTGTETDPYIIETPEQMAYLVSIGNKSLGNHYKIVADLKLNDTSYAGWEQDARQWINGYMEFGGHLDGDGHVISGLYFNTSHRHAALFPRITGGCVIEKLGITESSITNNVSDTVTETYVAPIAAYYGGWVDEEKGYTEPVISQCFADDTVYLEGFFVGGIVCGSPRLFHIDNCYFTGEIFAQDHHGTMIGNIWSTGVYISTVKDSFSAAFDRNKMSSNNGLQYIELEDYYHDGSAGNNMAIPVGLLFMKGDSAKEYMPDLDYSNIWMTVENGTPVLRCFKNAEKYSCTREPAKVEIAFVTGEGSACEPIYGLPGYDKITEDMLPTPTRYGYDFGGWYYFDELDIPFDLEVFPEYDTYLYAKWIQRGFDQGFEGTIDETYDFGEGAQLFKPGVQGYNPRFVHGGLRSARTLGNGTQGIFLLSYDNMLTVGNKYEITFWMNTATEGASGKVELLHANHGQVDSDIVGYETALEFTGLKSGTWVQYSYVITANAPFILFRTPADCELYFDDIQVIDIAETGELGKLEGFNPDAVGSEPYGGLGLVWIIVIIAGGVILLGGIATVVIILLKKKKKA